MKGEGFDCQTTLGTLARHERRNINDPEHRTGSWLGGIRTRTHSSTDSSSQRVYQFHHEPKNPGPPPVAADRGYCFLNLWVLLHKGGSPRASPADA